MKQVDNYTIGDLAETKRRIEETEQWVKQRSDQLPGPGWEHIKERLKEDREAIEGEINRRLPP